MLFTKRCSTRTTRRCTGGCKIETGEEYYIEHISGDATNVCKKHLKLYKEKLDLWGVTLSSDDIMELRLIKG